MSNKKANDILYVNKLIDQITKQYEIDARSRIRTDKYITLRVALIQFTRQFYPKLNYTDIGKIFKRHHSTIIHYTKNTQSFQQKNKVGMYYALWTTRILAIHPRIDSREQIECKALLGYL